ncbi:MAG: hypothetical protein ABIJ56_06930 [Pseudomonadota bacterium]
MAAINHRRTGTIAAAAACVLLFLLAPLPARALGSAEKGDCSIEAVAAERLTASYLRFPDEPLIYVDREDALLASVTRLLLEGDLSTYVDYEINLYADLSRAPATMAMAAAGGAFATAGSFQTPYRTTYLSWDFIEEDKLNGRLGIDRFSINIEVDRVTITVGRFPINYSKTRIFTPNDFFAPFSSAAVNKMYKPGVDALRVSVSLGMLSSIELAAVLGSDDDGSPSWGKTAFMLRAAAVKWSFEWAVLGGKLAGRWVLGASIQGEAGPFGLRAEAHAGFPDADGRGSLDDMDGDGESSDDIHGRLALGIDKMFTWHNIAISAEYMYVSDGAASPSDYLGRALRFYPDDQTFMGSHYVGLSAGGEIVPILMVQGMVLFNARDFSGLGALFFVHNMTDESDLVIGLLAPWGDKPSVDLNHFDPSSVIKSEFGLMPLTAFIECRVYF